MLARGKWLSLEKHALVGMCAERPPIRPSDVARVLEEPDHDDGNQAFARHRGRTIIVYYEEDPEEIRVRAVSATRTRLAP